MNMDNMTRRNIIYANAGAISFLERYAATVLTDLHTTSQIDWGITMHAPRTPDAQ
jgi:hypothetical protein